MRHRRLWRSGSVPAVLAALLSGPGALAQPAPAPRPAAPDPAFEAARAAFEALPEAERRALQDALVWTGDYNSVVAGTFGRRTFEGLNAYRTRTGLAGDPLDAPARARILAAGEAARAAARFSVKADPATGVVIGVPERLLSKRAAVPNGTRWQSADGTVTLESRAFPPGGPDLDALFERATAALPERRVTYKLKRPDFIVVTAETGSGRSYIRYAAGREGVRGFTVGYDRGRAAEVDRLVIAIANSFVPFPEAMPVQAPPPKPAAPSLPAAAGTAPSRPPAPGAAPPAPPPVAARVAGTGLVVAPGRVLTAAAVLEGCEPRLGAAAARVVRSDPGRGLALLEAAGLPGPVPPALAGPAEEGGATVLAAGSEGPLAAPGVVEAGGLAAPLQPGAAGAPVFDRSGRLVGLVARYPEAPRRVAGLVPPLRLPLAGGAALAGFLREAGLAPAALPAGGGSLGAVAAVFGPALVAITCGR